MAKHVAKHAARRVRKNAHRAQFLLGTMMVAGLAATGTSAGLVRTGVVDVPDANQLAQSLPPLAPIPSPTPAPAPNPTPDRVPDSVPAPDLSDGEASDSAPVAAPPAAEAPAPAPPAVASPVDYVMPLLGKTGTVTKTATLPPIPLAQAQNALLPGSIQDDRGVQLGSLGSGVFRVGADEYWTVTDRGPNLEVADDVHSFVVPSFDPMLVRVKVDGTTIKVVEGIPVTDVTGKPVGGLPNRNADDESTPLAADAKTVLPQDIDGLDPEGLVRTADGHFWLSDEYGPSLVE